MKVYFVGLVLFNDGLLFEEDAAGGAVLALHAFLLLQDYEESGVLELAAVRGLDGEGVLSESLLFFDLIADRGEGLLIFHFDAPLQGGQSALHFDLELYLSPLHPIIIKSFALAHPI